MGINFIRDIFYTNIIGEITLYSALSFILKFIFVFIALYFIYIIVKLLILDIRSVDFKERVKKYFITVKDPSGVEKKYALESLTKIGRSGLNDIILESDLVSKEHADIVFSSDSYFIIDKNSSNGTYVNESEVSGNIELLNNDVIEIGEYTLVFTEEILNSDNEG